MGRQLTVLALLASVAACHSGTKGGGFSASLGVDTTKMTKAASGLWFADVAVGQGEAAEPGPHRDGALHGLAPQRDQIRQQP
jgi:hypothetical protein